MEQKINTSKFDISDFIKKNWKIIAALLYLIFPLDFIADFLPLIGGVDDILILSISLILRYLEFRRDQKTPKDTIIEGEIVDE